MGGIPGPPKKPYKKGSVCIAADGAGQTVDNTRGAHANIKQELLRLPQVRGQEYLKVPLPVGRLQNDHEI